MDDLADKISQLLQDPETLNQIKGLTGLLGQTSAEPPKPQSTPQPESVNPLSGDTLQTVMKMAPLFASLRQEDDSTRLLQALRPLLGPERRRKLDESMHMLQLMRLLPLLKNSGIL